MDPVVGLILCTLGTMFLGCAGFAWVIESWAESRNGIRYCAECGYPNKSNQRFCEVCGKALNP